METTIEMLKFLPERGKPLNLSVETGRHLPHGKREYTLRKDSGEGSRFTGTENLNTEIDSLRLRLSFYPTEVRINCQEVERAKLAPFNAGQIIKYPMGNALGRSIEPLTPPPTKGVETAPSCFNTLAGGVLCRVALTDRQRQWTGFFGPKNQSETKHWKALDKLVINNLWEIHSQRLDLMTEEDLQNFHDRLNWRDEPGINESSIGKGEKLP